MAELPQGTVTFLFTDLEGSTRLWEDLPDEMRDALVEHDAILRGAIEASGGIVFSEMGDGMAAVFASPTGAENRIEGADTTEPVSATIHERKLGDLPQHRRGRRVD